MAYNKEHYEEQRLTPKQQKFVEGILEGKTQYESYLNAYPSSKTWQRSTVYERASVLMKNNKIVTRLAEAGYKQKEKIEWTRQKALETINYVMDLNRKDLERIDDACQTEIDLYEVKLSEKGRQMAKAGAEGNTRLTIQLAKEMQEITDTIAKLKKQKRANTTNIHRNI